jgi:hypothetical protein
VLQTFGFRRLDIAHQMPSLSPQPYNHPQPSHAQAQSSTQLNGSGVSYKPLPTGAITNNGSFVSNGEREKSG